MNPLDAAEEILRGEPFISCSVCTKDYLRALNCESCLSTGLECRPGYNEAREALGLPMVVPVQSLVALPPVKLRVLIDKETERSAKLF